MRKGYIYLSIQSLVFSNENKLHEMAQFPICNGVIIRKSESLKSRVYLFELMSFFLKNEKNCTQFV